MENAESRKKTEHFCAERQQKIFASNQHNDEKQQKRGILLRFYIKRLWILLGSIIILFVFYNIFT